MLVPGGQIRSKTDAFGLFHRSGWLRLEHRAALRQGGAAVTDRNYQFIGPAGALTSSTGYNTQSSPMVGVGLEYAFAPSWSVGVEYNQIFEGRHGATFTTPGGFFTAGFSSGGDTDKVLGRLNYKFGGPVEGFSAEIAKREPSMRWLLAHQTHGLWCTSVMSTLGSIAPRSTDFPCRRESSLDSGRHSTHIVIRP